ncbi:MAG: hypothetical protein AB7P69_04045 [Candidatus Binatia bacterium]
MPFDITACPVSALRLTIKGKSFSKAALLTGVLALPKKISWVRLFNHGKKEGRSMLRPYKADC